MEAENFEFTDEVMKLIMDDSPLVINGLHCEVSYINFSKDYSNKMTRSFSMPEFNEDFIYMLLDSEFTDLLVTIFDHGLKVYEFALWQGGWSGEEVSIYDNGEVDITKAKEYIAKIMNTIPE